MCNKDCFHAERVLLKNVRNIQLEILQRFVHLFPVGLQYNLRAILVEVY